VGENTVTATVIENDFPDSETLFFVNTANVQHNIDEKIYGHFLEHIFHSTNGGLWGDLVWNRSFEYDDVWGSLGGGTITLDADALNDEYSIKIVDATGTTSLIQYNFKFTQQQYSGSLWMKGSRPDGLKVQLMDGTTVLGEATLPAPDASWTEYPFQITSSGSTEQGSLKISPLGPGTVYIDQVSMMGQDAIDTGGYRPDLLQAVTDLAPPVIRYPGGCYASAYSWKDGIGPQHTRHKYPTYLWEDFDTNSYGTDEFLRMCESLGAEPVLVVNTGLLDEACGMPVTVKQTAAQYLQDALDWMEYCNGSTSTYWGAKRAENGHPAP
jgi:alpha-N-arabinofuranosidase